MTRYQETCGVGYNLGGPDVTILRCCTGGNSSQGLNVRFSKLVLTVDQAHRSLCALSELTEKLYQPAILGMVPPISPPTLVRHRA